MGGRPQHSSSSLAGIVLALSHTAMAGKVLLFDFEGYVSLLLSQDLIHWLRCQATWRWPAGYKRGLLRCVGP
jgi:hypothetical protein